MPKHSFLMRRRFSSKRLLCFSVIFLFVQGCSQSRFGQKLATSFDIPSDETSLEKSSSILEPKIQIPVNISKPLVEEKTPLPALRNLPRKETKKIVQSVPLSPHPYRITIKLSKADPSAPAEAVTKALRNAGVSFEVEMIERLQFEKALRERKPTRTGGKR